eukprot:2169327-Rhodomonas_salina.1
MSHGKGCAFFNFEFRLNVPETTQHFEFRLNVPETTQHTVEEHRLKHRNHAHAVQTDINRSNRLGQRHLHRSNPTRPPSSTQFFETRKANGCVLHRLRFSSERRLTPVKKHRQRTCNILMPFKLL